MRYFIDLMEKTFSPRQSRYDWPTAGDRVDGLVVRSDIPNTGSIASSFDDYVILPGVREVPFSAFSGPGHPTARTKDLSQQIMASGEINPLIVAVDSYNGPYILEGAHRFDALQFLGKTSFPALVVLDNDDGFFDDEAFEDEPESVPVHPDQLKLL